MRCNECHENIAAFVLGALADDEARSVEAHLSVCPTCAADVHCYQSIIDLLPLTVQLFEPPPMLWERILNRIESSRANDAPDTKIS
jgi:anti-sigma factor RsiW